MHCMCDSIVVITVDCQFRCRYHQIDPKNICIILTVFIVTECQLFLILEALKNDNKRVTHIPYETRHQIRQLAYFCMIHASDLTCRQSTRMDRRTFAILCHLLRTSVGLTSTECIDVEEIAAMFLHILAHIGYLW
ncbi:hypothetical protein Csa_001381, partial [Cucumis sativus]